MWRLSGIFRSVAIHSKDKTHVRDLFVQTTPVENGQWKLSVAVDIVGQPVKIDAMLYDEAGKEISPVSVAGENLFSHPALWSAETPNLYTLVGFRTRTDTIMGPAGDEIAAEQLAVKNPAGDVKPALAVAGANPTVSEDDEITTISGKDFQAVFDKRTGELTALEYAGKPVFKPGKGVSRRLRRASVRRLRDRPRHPVRQDRLHHGAARRVCKGRILRPRPRGELS
jgi:beta-galactosidase/beta-glucuronidase